jgi:hypothetical protein
VGVVRSFTTERMQLPHQATVPGGDVRIAADPIGGTGIYLSPSLVIADGDAVEMVVENVLAQPSVIVRGRESGTPERWAPGTRDSPGEATARAWRR